MRRRTAGLVLAVIVWGVDDGRGPDHYHDVEHVELDDQLHDVHHDAGNDQHHPPGSLCRAALHGPAA